MTTSVSRSTTSESSLVGRPPDEQIQRDALAELKWDARVAPNEIGVSVKDGVVTLTGTVDVYSQKEDLDKRVHRIKNIKGVENEVEVAGPEISDAELQEKLVKAISYDRVGYGTTPFNAINVNVQNGAVTLGMTPTRPPPSA